LRESSNRNYNQSARRCRGLELNSVPPPEDRVLIPSIRAKSSLQE
jgi:hypothetical protein